MKKLLLFILLLSGLKTFAQVTDTLEAGTNPFVPDYSYKAITPDSLNHLWIYNSLTGKYNRIFTATESNLKYLYKTDTTSLSHRIDQKANLAGVNTFTDLQNFNGETDFHNTTKFLKDLNVQNGSMGLSNDTGNPNYVGFRIFGNLPIQFMTTDENAAVVMRNYGANAAESKLTIVSEGGAIGIRGNDIRDNNNNIFLKTYQADSAYQKLAEKGIANGYAGLDGEGKIPLSLLPSTIGGSLEGVDIDTLGNEVLKGTITSQTPIGTAGTDSIAVKIGNTKKFGAIAGNYYLPTVTAASTYAPLINPLLTNVKAASTFQTPSGAAGSDSIVVKTGNTQKLGAIPASYYAKLAGGNLFTDDQYFTGNLYGANWHILNGTYTGALFDNTTSNAFYVGSDPVRGAYLKFLSGYDDGPVYGWQMAGGNASVNAPFVFSYNGTPIWQAKEDGKLYDGSGNRYLTTIDEADIPYTGATQSIYLGTHDIHIDGVGSGVHVGEDTGGGTLQYFAGFKALYGVNAFGYTGNAFLHSQYLQSVSGGTTTFNLAFGQTPTQQNTITGNAVQFQGGLQSTTTPSTSLDVVRLGDLSTYIPYTGATTDVNLGSHNLSIGGSGTPNARLDVDGTTLSSGTTANLGVGNDLSFLENSGKMLTGWNHTASEGETDFISNQGPGIYGGFAFYNHDNTGAETQLMRIKGNGNVGIGAIYPDEKLTVDGTIHTKEVKVNIDGWSDYVFNNAYKLPSLAEVKTYIDQNHHLPEIPSEQQVIKGGLKLGEINKLLTKKVEELTLYLIEKDGQDKSKDTQLRSQQEQINQLKQQLSLITKALTKNQ